jgi:hypothetical protein
LGQFEEQSTAFLGLRAAAAKNATWGKQALVVYSIYCRAPPQKNHIQARIRPANITILMALFENPETLFAKKINNRDQELLLRSHILMGNRFYLGLRHLFYTGRMHEHLDQAFTG